ncbi:hypothetical protein DAPPUDRAFT_101685 [Daphnia pulex]|uniref:Uncharacterized protein n=1 Tax=Daphnia pulex TaxID=6669 RepID=E9GE73_DAPPU|nr:hypothetical protein DAPPUDRAFT_101685 [Daphnia pulex]|eukprot:EFX82362.1 hypothetical protein DAPPUDRAFT_101685 [Daphnia pulex]
MSSLFPVPAERFVKNTSGQLKFIVYVPVVTARCGTLLHPMLVKDIFASSCINIKFIVYVPVIAVRCGTLLQPMLVYRLRPRNCCPMWDVVAAYAGERFFCIKGGEFISFLFVDAVYKRLQASKALNTFYRDTNIFQSPEKIKALEESRFCTIDRFVTHAQPTSLLLMLPRNLSYFTDEFDHFSDRFRPL